MAKLYKVISHKYAEKIIDELNEHSLDGWDVVAYVQEFGVTKFVLQRDATRDEEKKLIQLKEDKNVNPV